jgi:2-polyprenyl-3-methyl-5-hydroxy-6-metoxy-1,4-benzoquinol methylase
MNIEELYQKDLTRFLGFINEKYREWAQTYLTASVHKTRYINMINMISQLSPATICDIGSFPFYMDFLIAKSNPKAQVDCIDIDTGRIDKEVFNNLKNLRHYEYDLDSYNSFPMNKKYDVVLFLEVFEHLRHDLIYAFESMKQLMHKDSKIFIQVPNLYHWRKLIDYFKGKGIIDYYAEYRKLSLFGHMGHVRLPSKYEVTSFLENLGYRIDTILKVDYTKANKNGRYFFKNSHLLFIASINQE